MSRPWHKGTPCPHLVADVLGQFDTFDDWVNHAPRALTGFTGSVGEEIRPICIDSLGRRCHLGADFMRARDEGTFPVRYFIRMKPAAERASKDVMSLDRALFILGRVHTRDDIHAGFVVQVGAYPDYGNLVSPAEYIAAWNTVRKHLHQPTEPPSDLSDQIGS